MDKEYEINKMEISLIFLKNTISKEIEISEFTQNYIIWNVCFDGFTLQAQSNIDSPTELYAWKFSSIFVDDALMKKIINKLSEIKMDK